MAARSRSEQPATLDFIHVQEIMTDSEELGCRKLSGFTMKALAAIILVILAGGICAAQTRADPRLFLVEVNGKSGFIDPSGKIVIAAQFDNAREFSEGFALVPLHGRRFFIDQTGKTIFERSEEHTSELQSRFGISYAVFCL